MNPRKIKDGLHWIGVVDWDRRLFDSLIPLPDGTSYNAYLLEGTDRRVLLDTVDSAYATDWRRMLDGVERLDYLVAHHAEQDHAGAIPAVLECRPECTVLASEKCKGMLIDHLHLPPERIRAVADGETVDLGGRTLEFVHTPWVHWPETICTFLPQDRILFSCDFFGSHLATTDLFVRDRGQVYEAAKRYYAEIMMPFRGVIRRNLEKVRARAPAWIAPSHGPLYDDPAFILDAYEDWVNGPPKNEVVLPYISMHGSTETMVRRLVAALAERGVTVRQFNLSVTDIGKLAIALVDAATLVVGTPTVHIGPHPAVFYAAHLANALRPKLQFASIIGSYGWSSKAIERIAALIPDLKVELLDPVLCRGYPRAADFTALDRLADQIADQHRARNLADG
jgi:flavorubredoxin